MSRFDTLEQKIYKLIDRSFVGTRQNIEHGVQVSQDTAQRQLEEVIALMQYFQDKKLYIMDLPIALIHSPHGARRLVDPNLRGTPSNKTIQADPHRFNNSYDLVEGLNNLLNQEKEVFLYSLDFISVFNPHDFIPEYRIMARFCDIDLSYWDTPIYNSDDIYIPNQNITINFNDEQPSKEEGTLKIINNILRHKF